MAIVTENSGSFLTTHTDGTGSTARVYRINTTCNAKRVVMINVSASIPTEPSTACTEANMKALHNTVANAVKSAISTAFYPTT